ncbi:MFS general substrate transporter [Sistotremastrum suecicum HHB10207 ss-3]|uniref:MFS general substrate transporter n=1 Tax=Sistotremastrum suecicum HHB10207 ss-3 TaxID=1314776 RepID=A0A166JDA6_9AGAM|nr:MFS general substrate transporter [Sistotremastrum suecicum HHB10207 ss-3]
MRSSFSDNEQEYDSEAGDGSDTEEPRTPLDKTFDRIGMGAYQWVLLSLCGFGWLADNMWLQAVAIVLPRVQRHYEISDRSIGFMSSAVHAGMMVGALGWGTCSDLLGRITAFNGTLFLTSLFGLVCSLAGSFNWLCISLFLLGSAVGGSMPTDGTLISEHMPRGKQYLVTALSVFFSIGGVLTAVVGILVIPSNSCGPLGTVPCDTQEYNKGWRYLLQILALFTLVMFLCRILFFTLHESPRYLVHAGRHREAIISLQKISAFNGEPVRLELSDVQDTYKESLEGTLLDRENPPPPTVIVPQNQYAVYGDYDQEAAGVVQASPLLADERSPSPSESALRVEDAVLDQQSRRMRASANKIAAVLSPEWRRTTLLVWATWWTMSLAFTMFNVFLPKLLEARSIGSDHGSEDIAGSLMSVLIYSLGGCPGALLGAWMQVTSLGRRLSLALSTVATAFFCLLFVHVQVQWLLRLATMGISLCATIMWAILYGWTPTIFATELRGTACGSASALSRIGGIIAPLLGGWLLMLDPAFPVYASAAAFVLAGICVLALPEHGNGDRRSLAAEAIH